MKQKLVVLTGAGISAESGLQTFRGNDGLWEGYKIEEVATPQAWMNNPAMVQEFYNKRREGVLNAEPNAAHLALVELEKWYDVFIITQNIDNLHERAGSKQVLHLHGEITKSQSTMNPGLIYDIDGPLLNMGDKCELGSQLRPFIVWFGEAVPKMEEAIPIVESADLFVVVGTSLVVYPAAGLVQYTHPGIPVYVIDPGELNMRNSSNITFIREPATTGMEKLKMMLAGTR